MGAAQAGQWGSHVANGAIYKLPYDLLADFAPVAWIANGTPLIVSRNSVPAATLTEFIAWLKANPGKTMEGTAGVGSPQHIAGVYFQSVTGTRFQFVHYRRRRSRDAGSARRQYRFHDRSGDQLVAASAGKIRAYAACAKARLAAAPDIPSVDEAGLPEFYMPIWQALWVPKGTPRDIVAKLNSAVVSALGSPSVIKRYADIVQEAPPPEQQTPEALAALQRAEIAKWWPMIKAAGITPE